MDNSTDTSEIQPPSLLKLVSGKPGLVIISGPTAGGKTTLCRWILESNPDNCVRPVSATTRERQGNEVHGVDYYFLTPAGFQTLEDNNLFLETSTVYGLHRYGTLLEPTLDALKKGSVCILPIDVQGHAKIREKSQLYPQLRGQVFSFFISADRAILEERLLKRARQRPLPEEEIKRRLASADVEIARAGKYDRRIESTTPVNDYTTFVNELNNLLLAAMPPNQ